MNFDPTEEEQAFAKEVKEFLDGALTDEIRGTFLIDTPARKEFVNQLAERGWLSMGFPEEYGGTKQPMALAQYVLNQELHKADAPMIGKNVGIIANSILNHGSEAMKSEFLPKIFRNEAQWALTYTEPEAGSDLASLRCRAVQEGDEFVVNGSKRFITGAHYCDYYWTAVRTDLEAQKHKGISLLIIDSRTPGITIAPTYCVGNSVAERTNEVVFDDVRVPAGNLVGELNRGWYYLVEALDYERLGTTSFIPTLRRFDRLVDWVKTATVRGKPLKDDPVVRQKMAHMAVQMEVGRMLELRGICALADHIPTIESAMLKAWGAIVWSEMADMALDIMGPSGYLWGENSDAPMAGDMADQYLMSGHMRVAAGGVDIAKGIIAKRLLNMPNG
jgi:alkylation response protein AidB-like acyl-CoA dehydrogenase